VAEHFSRLSSQTRLWRDTWYDSSLPYWFLNRTFANTSTLATSTCYLLGDNRFYADEGVGCCAGTCTHVWQYAQAPGRLFPEIERNHREFVDFGLAFTADGVVSYRGEHGDWFAIDGHAGRILGVYREHQMTPDGAFLKRVWPNVKKAIQRMITADKDDDGILHGPLHNTLDADWTGIVPWVNGMYHAALKAGEIMARENGDEAFAKQCAEILKKGMVNMDKLCWREEYGYYVQIGDPAKPTEVGAYEGCHIDQVLGQAWALQLGIGEVITHAHARKCLESLWKYNFTPDVGPFRKVKTAGRWYAMPGEGGLIMLSNPFAPDIEFTGPSAPTAMYFNECMSGFEHQVAAHMMWENMLTESLAITRVIHDRYSPKLRNPYNEIECSDHYGRAMASYGTYLAACGYEYDGPKKHLGFAPRLTPENFKAAFTSAEGPCPKFTSRPTAAR
jgi:non-lysosomal glucosylceramidase